MKRKRHVTVFRSTLLMGVLLGSTTIAVGGAAAAGASVTHTFADPGAVVPASSTTPPAVHAASAQSSTDAQGPVYDSTGATVTNYEQADIHTASAQDDNGTISLALNTYDSPTPNPLTDPGWQTNTSTLAVTYAAWVLVTPAGQQYTAYFYTNGTSVGSLDGEVDVASSGSSVVVSCQVTPTYDPAAGYELSFSSSCVGAPSSFEWYSYLIYHPTGTPLSYLVGKDDPEEPTFPTQATFANPVYAVTPIVKTGVSPADTGYWLVASDGGVFSEGQAHFYGSTGNIKLNQPIIGSAPTADGRGYWLVASDGGVFAFGDAQFYGSTGAKKLNRPIVAMAATPDGGGYWLVASDGGVFTFGDAKFYGSTGSTKLNEPIVGIASTPDGRGYWLVASDGGVFAFGDAKYYGSTGAIKLNQPVIGLEPTADGAGYWLVASDGGVFTFGDAQFFGSTGLTKLNKPIVNLAPTADNAGYWLVASDGGIFSFGDAQFFGSTGALKLNKPIVAVDPTLG
jgi:ribosomal protein L24E